jgi:hypothetical protein
MAASLSIVRVRDRGKSFAESTMSAETIAETIIAEESLSSL